MDLVIVLLVGLLIGLALGVAGGVLVARSRAEDSGTGEDPAVVQARHEAAVAQVRHEEASARADVERRLAAAQASIEGLQQAVEAAQQQYRDTVETHRREAKERESAAAAESKVLQKLSPVTTQLRSMQQKVDEIEKQRAGQHSALAEQLRVSQETAEKSRQAAEALSSALKNNATRGAYGETQLQSLVESAGLLNRVDFSMQESITADSGARRPDMVIKLPGRKQMAIDAKVPYSCFIEAHESGDEQRSKQLLVQHARQVKAHVDALSGKEYWTGLPTSPEFTIAFIPSEAILNAALDADPTLMEHAFGRGIVLATPVNLWAVLKTVAFTWKQEDLAEHAQQVVDLGRELYKRLGTLSEHVAKLGRSLERSVGDYNKFVGSLERGVLVTARKLDGFDDTALEPVAPIEADARSLTTAEMTSGETPAEFAAFEDLERPELDLTIGVETTDDERDAG
ncbi:DNA recombination protein RmuC [Aeromicrobium sp. CTD01-1L150]|uniref:DNA recombination protein RmuC n=1 Tax=Aeromicrobium sp. CTD01-1L150 TaxID=3341830 RepID=UPI0035C1B918